MEAKRIVSRPDFDGIVCAVLLADAMGIGASVKWVEPAEMQKKKVQIEAGDVIANLPYDPRCRLWFDHHFTNVVKGDFEGAFRLAPSAARVIYDHFSGRFSRDFEELVRQTDRIDSADLTEDEVLHPERYPYVILSMTIKGPGRDETYWNRITDLLGRLPIDRVMEDPQVKTHCMAAIEENRRYKILLETHTRIDGPVSITDFRALDSPPTGNRFLVFSLFPETVVNVKIHHHERDRRKIVVHLGHSIINRSCRVNVGLLLSSFEGGGHRGAGAATFNAERFDQYVPAIVEALKRNDPNETGP